MSQQQHAFDLEGIGLPLIENPVFYFAHRIGSEHGFYDDLEAFISQLLVVFVEFLEERNRILRINEDENFTFLGSFFQMKPGMDVAIALKGKVVFFLGDFEFRFFCRRSPFVEIAMCQRRERI